MSQDAPGAFGAENNEIEIMEIIDLSNSDTISSSDSEGQRIIEIESKSLRRKGRFSTFMNLTNALLGAGIITMSNSFKALGVGPAVVMLIVSCVMCYVSGVVLLNLQHDLGIGSIDELANGIFGRPCQILISLLIVFFDLAYTTTYLVIGADCILSWIRCSNVKWAGFGPWAGILVVYSIILPIAMTVPKKLRFLEKFQMFTIILIVFYAVVISARIFSTEKVPAPSVVGTKFSMSVFTAFAFHCLSFCLPIHMLPIISAYNFNPLKRKTIMGSSLLFCFLVIVIPGIAGYLMFGDDATSNLLRSFSDMDGLMIVARIAIFLVVTFSYPVIAIEMVGTIGGFAFHINDPAEMRNHQRLILLLVVNIISLLFALVSNNMTPILGIGGALGALLVAFAFPSICRLKITHSKLSSPRNIGHICFAIFGISMACICLYTSVHDLIESYKQGSIQDH